jgi:hypothetical protein
VRSGSAHRLVGEAAGVPPHAASRVSRTNRIVRR